ncbi:MAG TPA: hypothetical protein VMB81_15830, partial [Candidatus Sulfotelmatobacter sp.]|nr:hypothetical protein [Candidatus Sulfotelmatobacter sp.]
LQQVGLALATSLSSWLNFVLLALTLHRRGFLTLDRRLKRSLAPLAAATVGMAFALKLALAVLDPWLRIPGLTGRVAALAVLIAVGLGAFAVLALLLGAVDRKALGGALGRLLRRNGASA